MITQAYKIEVTLVIEILAVVPLSITETFSNQDLTVRLRQTAVV
jgi:hypothetical protein